MGLLCFINCSPEVPDMGIRSKTMDGLEDEEFDVSLTKEAQRAARNCYYKQHNVCTKYYHELLQEIASH